MFFDETMIFPADVAKAYRLIKNNEFEEERKQCFYLLCCLRTVELIYGIVPIDIFKKLMDRNPSVSVSEDEIKAAITDIPFDLNLYFR